MSQLPTELGYHTSHTVMPGAPKGPGYAWMQFFLTPLIWGVPCLFATAIVMGISGIGFTPIGWIFAPIVGTFAIYSIYRAVKLRRQRNAELVAGYVESAVRLNLPLTPYLLAAERSERGSRRRQLAALHQTLAAGFPVHQALRDSTYLAEPDLAAIAAHESIGQLPTALATLSARLHKDPRTTYIEQNQALYSFYQIYLLFFTIAMSIFYGIFVVPKFRDIFKDFKTTLPARTNHLIAVNDFLFSDHFWFGPLVLLLLLAAMFIPATVWMQKIFFPRWPLPPFARISDWIAWRTPLFHGLHRDRALGQACALLAQATRSGIPISDALGRAMTLSMNEGFRHRLAVWRKELANGATLAAGARNAGLPTLFVGFLGPLHTNAAHNPADANIFDFLGRHYRDRFSRTLLMLRGAAEPLLVLLCGAIVMFYVLALFEPLVVLIRSVMGQSPEVSP